MATEDWNPVAVLFPNVIYHEMVVIALPLCYVYFVGIRACLSSRHTLCKHNKYRDENTLIQELFPNHASSFYMLIFNYLPKINLGVTFGRHCRMLIYEYSIIVRFAKYFANGRVARRAQGCEWLVIVKPRKPLSTIIIGRLSPPLAPSTDGWNQTLCVCVFCCCKHKYAPAMPRNSVLNVPYQAYRRINSTWPHSTQTNGETHHRNVRCPEKFFFSGMEVWRSPYDMGDRRPATTKWDLWRVVNGFFGVCPRGGHLLHSMVEGGGVSSIRVSVSVKRGNWGRVNGVCV